LSFARAVGLNAILSPSAHAPQADAPLAGELAPAVVIEATGHPDAANSAFGIAAPGGRVVLLGSTRGATAEVNFYRDVHRKGLTVIGAHDIARPDHDSYPGYWTAAQDRTVGLRLLAADRLQVRPLITHRVGWRDAESAYEMLRNWESGALGIVLDWAD
jgi:L-iditol 2-dehydrogenase